MTSAWKYQPPPKWLCKCVTKYTLDQSMTTQFFMAKELCFPNWVLNQPIGHWRSLCEWSGGGPIVDLQSECLHVSGSQDQHSLPHIWRRCVMRFQERKNATGSWANLGRHSLLRNWRDCESKREAKVCCMRDTMDPRWHSVSIQKSLNNILTVSASRWALWRMETMAPHTVWFLHSSGLPPKGTWTLSLSLLLSLHIFLDSMKQQHTSIRLGSVKT